MSIRIEGIFSTPTASGHMVPLERANLRQGVGLEGDRYANRAGTYSVLAPEPGRQLTLISSEGVREAFGARGMDWDAQNRSMGDLRRNVVLQGISSRELLDCIGSVIHLGGKAKVLVHRNCVPCMYNERKNGIQGMMEVLWDAGGVSCEVIEGGTIVVCDAVTIDSSGGNGRAVDDGQKPSWFYIRPSKRTAAMVREGLEGKKRDHEILKTSDPEGVARAQASYETVGLNFWPKP